MERLMFGIQHIFNPLHIYCRLVDAGISRGVSIRLSRCYEIAVYKWLNLLAITSIAIPWKSRMRLERTFRDNLCSSAWN